MPRDLFGDDLDGQDDAKPGLRVNEEYAKRFEHNKRRVELHRLQAKHPDVAAKVVAQALEGQESGGSSEESSSEDEDDGVVPVAQDKEWAQALLSIRSRDPSIYNANSRLFTQPESSTDEDGGSEGAAAADGGVGGTRGTSATARAGGSDGVSGQSARGKRQTLREVLYEQAVDGREPEDESTDRERRARGARSARASELAYDVEQRQLRAQLLSRLHTSEAERDEDGSVSSSDDDGGAGGLRVKQRLEPDDAEDAAVEDVNARLSEFFAPSSAPAAGSKREPGDAFLHSYLTRRLWMEEGDDAGDSKGLMRAEEQRAARLGASALEVAEDEQFLDDADDFERSYNFRSEEPGGAVIATYPRQLDGLARRQESGRKRQRASKQERAEQLKQEQKLEVKRLKNLKRKELKTAVQSLAAVSGKAAPDTGLLSNLLNADFDPAQWDKCMEAAFDDAYYAATEREADVLAGAEEVDEETEAWEAGQEGARQEGGAAGARSFMGLNEQRTGSRKLSLKESDYDADIGVLGNEEADDAGVAVVAESRDKIHELLSEYHKLDFEDEVGGIKTRFRYRAVEPVRDGLDVAEIFALPDRDLNAIVGLRKLAPYHEDVARIRPNYKALSAARDKLGQSELYRPRKKKEARKAEGGQATGRGEGDAHKGGPAQRPGKKATQAAGSEGIETIGRGGGAAGAAAPELQEERKPGKKGRRSVSERGGLKTSAVQQAPGGGGSADGDAGAAVQARGKGKKRQRGEGDARLSGHGGTGGSDADARPGRLGGNVKAAETATPAVMRKDANKDAMREARMVSYAKLTVPGRREARDQQGLVGERPVGKGVKPNAKRRKRAKV